MHCIFIYTVEGRYTVAVPDSNISFLASFLCSDSSELIHSPDTISNGKGAML